MSLLPPPFPTHNITVGCVVAALQSVGVAHCQHHRIQRLYKWTPAATQQRCRFSMELQVISHCHTTAVHASSRRFQSFTRVEECSFITRTQPAAENLIRTFSACCLSPRKSMTFQMKIKSPQSDWFNSRCFTGGPSERFDVSFVNNLAT